MSDEKQKKQTSKAALICAVLFLAAAVVAGIIWAVQLVNQGQAQEQYEQLAADTAMTEDDADETMQVDIQESSDASEEEVQQTDSIETLREKGIPIPEKEVDFADLQANVNADIYAWIYIPDSKIDYPILQHPTDNYYYLNYNLDGSKGYPGCIYTEDYNKTDFSDPNTVIYGHNMKNGSMFAGLHNYEDTQYFEENPYVYIYTPEKLLVYEIFAAYEYDSKHILYNYDFTNKTIYQNYLDEIDSIRSMNCNIREGVEVTVEDKIITMSTCIANKADKRYLVQGVLLNED